MAKNLLQNFILYKNVNRLQLRQLSTILSSAASSSCLSFHNTNYSHLCTSISGGGKRFYSNQESTIQKDGKSFQTEEIRRIKMFMNPEIQSLLRNISGHESSRIFRKRKLGQKLREPKYKFMTEKELKIALEDANKQAESLMKMPPVLPARKPIDKVLSFDPQIQGYINYTLLMIDISMNVKERDRLVVAREPCGTLRLANWEEKDRLIKTYFPKKGRTFYTPKMLQDPIVMKEVLERANKDDNTYEFVLDRACFQFEPDDPLYISAMETTYEMINAKQHYDFLKSTRHYGPMVFYFVRTRKMDQIVLFNILNERLDDILILISLFHKIFPDSKSKSIAQTSQDTNEIIQSYIQQDSLMKSEQELAFNSYLEIQKKRKDLESDIERAHG